METITILKDLVAINTIKDKDKDQINAYLRKFLEEEGFKCGDINGNLVASIKDDFVLGFSGHTDTVDIAEGYLTNPFELFIEGDKAIGLGACDMKGGIACILKAIKESNPKTYKRGMKLYFTYDEEIGFEGIKGLADETFPDMMVIAEPTNNIPVIKTKGCLDYRINFSGVSTHASTPKKGDSAILKAISFIKDLDNIKLDGNDLDFIEPKTTYNVGKINGGTAANMVPDKCEITLEFRPVNLNDSVKIETAVNELVKKYDAVLTVDALAEPLMNDIETINNLELGKYKAECFVTEGSFMKAKNKIILGPGPITAHEKNEYVSIKSLNETVKTYIALIEKYCK